MTLGTPRFTFFFFINAITSNIVPTFSFQGVNHVACYPSSIPTGKFNYCILPILVLVEVQTPHGEALSLPHDAYYA